MMCQIGATKVRKGNLQKRGFTLIELLFVVFLLALIAGFGIPKMNELTSGNLRSASRRISTLIKYAYSQSVLKRTRVRLVLDLDSEKYWLEHYIKFDPPQQNEQDDDLELGDDESEEEKPLGEFIVSDTGIGKPRLAPKGVDLVRTVDVNQQLETKEGKAYVYFYPNGEATGSYIFLGAGNSLNITLRVHPVTGEVEAILGVAEVSQTF